MYFLLHPFKQRIPIQEFQMLSGSRFHLQSQVVSTQAFLTWKPQLKQRSIPAVIAGSLFIP